MRGTSRIALCFGSISVSAMTLAFGCNSGYYEVCNDLVRAVSGTFGIITGRQTRCVCAPNGGTVTAAPAAGAAQLPTDILHIRDGAGKVIETKGNFSALYLAIGQTARHLDPNVALTSGAALNEEEREFVDTVAGRGIVEYATTGNWYLVVADAATSVVLHAELGEGPPSGPPDVPTSVASVSKFHATEATCLQEETKKQQVVASWVRPPKLTPDHSVSGAFVYPNGELKRGEVIEVTSTNKYCGSLSKFPNQKYLSQAKFTYAGDSAHSGQVGVRLRFFIWGSLSK
jgi:hypothetical protein